jgi:hypothetical protein
MRGYPMRVIRYPIDKTVKELASMAQKTKRKNK